MPDYIDDVLEFLNLKDTPLEKATKRKAKLDSMAERVGRIDSLVSERYNEEPEIWQQEYEAVQGLVDTFEFQRSKYADIIERNKPQQPEIPVETEQPEILPGRLAGFGWSEHR